MKWSWNSKNKVIANNVDSEIKNNEEKDENENNNNISNSENNYYIFWNEIIRKTDNPYEIPDDF